MAWTTGSPELVAAVRTAKQFLTYVASGPFQYAITEALALPDNSVFYDDPAAGRTQVRFAFCKRADVPKEAAARSSQL